ncbi:conserved hypothetical protein [Ricinus communis]|uniref:Uncharacterized protein n=1 Tax=Ricinus communis TaxID=3988 RepID=B9TMP1_RICCO|nr:conserved hypothetical protein [Ricinus communis]
MGALGLVARRRTLGEAVDGRVDAVGQRSGVILEEEVGGAHRAAVEALCDARPLQHQQLALQGGNLLQRRARLVIAGQRLQVADDRIEAPVRALQLDQQGLVAIDDDDRHQRILTHLLAAQVVGEDHGAGIDRVQSVLSDREAGQEKQRGGQQRQEGQGDRPHQHEQPAFVTDHPGSFRPCADQAAAWSFSTPSDTMARVSSWVASRMTWGAMPASSASRQRPAHRHQRSPGLSPRKANSGRGVERSLPVDLEKARNSSVIKAQTVCRPRSCGPVSQQPLR